MARGLWLRELQAGCGAGATPRSVDFLLLALCGLTCLLQNGGQRGLLMLKTVVTTTLRAEPCSFFLAEWNAPRRRNPAIMGSHLRHACRRRLARFCTGLCNGCEAARALSRTHTLIAAQTSTVVRVQEGGAILAQPLRCRKASQIADVVTALIAAEKHHRCRVELPLWGEVILVNLDQSGSVWPKWSQRGLASGSVPAIREGVRADSHLAYDYRAFRWLKYGQTAPGCQRKVGATAIRKTLIHSYTYLYPWVPGCCPSRQAAGFGLQRLAGCTGSAVSRAARCFLAGRGPPLARS